MDSTVKNLIISDFDMTFFNFKEVDNKIIKEIFENYKFVLFIDNLLWKVNSLGIIGNSMNGLKLRFLIYSILTFFTGHIKYDKIFSKYEFMYKRLVMKKYKRKVWLINQIEKKGYKFIILTNNRFASELGISDIIYTKSKKKYLKKCRPKYLVGDNFWDDYRSLPRGSKYINVGGGVLSKINSKKIRSIKNLYEIFNVI